MDALIMLQFERNIILRETFAFILEGRITTPDYRIFHV